MLKNLKKKYSQKSANDQRFYNKFEILNNKKQPMFPFTWLFVFLWGALVPILIVDYMPSVKKLVNCNGKTWLLFFLSFMIWLIALFVLIDHFHSVELDYAIYCLNPRQQRSCFNWQQVKSPIKVDHKFWRKLTRRQQWQYVFDHCNVN